MVLSQKFASSDLLGRGFRWITSMRSSNLHQHDSLLRSKSNSSAKSNNRLSRSLTWPPTSKLGHLPSQLPPRRSLQDHRHNAFILCEDTTCSLGKSEPNLNNLRSPQSCQVPTLAIVHPESRDIRAIPTFYKEPLHSFKGDKYVFSVEDELVRLPARLEYPGASSSTHFEVIFSQSAIGSFVGQVGIRTNSVTCCYCLHFFCRISLTALQEGAVHTSTKHVLASLYARTHRAGNIPHL